MYIKKIEVACHMKRFIQKKIIDQRPNENQQDTVEDPTIEITQKKLHTHRSYAEDKKALIQYC